MRPTDSPFWWQLEQPKKAADSKVHEQLYDLVKSIEERQFSIHQQNLFNAKLYSNRELMGIDWSTHTERYSNYGPASYTAENLVASVVSTVTALISKNWAKPTPVIKNADFETEMAAKDADRYLYGEFKRLNAWQRLQRMFNDACWAQVGAVRVDIDDGEIYMERVNPDELIVDQRECISDCDNPLQVHHRRVINRQVLLEMFPDRADDINDLQGTGNDWTSYRGPTSDNVVVIESWRLGHKGTDGKRKPGRHTIIIRETTLLDEPFERDRFPFLFFRWELPLTGFYGKSLVEEITPFQLRMNQLNKTIEKSQDLMSVPRIFIEGSSKIVREQIDNEVGRVLMYRGKTPTVMNWTAVHPELYQERERVRSSAFEYAGVSQLSAQAKLPDNVRLDSSKALREFSLRENERFALQAQRYEQLIIDLAEHILMLSSELYKNNVNKKVQFVDRSVVDDIDWKTVAKFFKERRYVFQLEASSITNMTPAAREDIINTWANQGIIDITQYKALLQNPDLEEVEDLVAAGIDDLKWTSSQLDRGRYLPPEPEQDLQNGIPFMQKTLLKRKRQKAPEQVLEDYRTWIAQAQGILDQATAMASVRQKQLEAQAMQQMQMEQGGAGGAQPPMPMDPSALQGPPGAFQTPNMGPEGNVMPGVAATTQGVPANQAGGGF